MLGNFFFFITAKKDLVNSIDTNDKVSVLFQQKIF